MHFVGLYRLESPFPFAAAIVAICDDRGPNVGESFLFVENRSNFIGFQRVILPHSVSDSDARLRMRELVQRVHAKMRNAATRNGRLPWTEAADKTRLFEARSDLVAELWTKRGFAGLLDWVAKQTASTSLRTEIESCRASDRPRLTPSRANQI